LLRDQGPDGGVQLLSERGHAIMIVKHQATDKALPTSFL
jgi:hypothetical protein